MMSNSRKKFCFRAGKIVLYVLLVSVALCGCSKDEKSTSNGLNKSNIHDTSTEAEPVTLEQVLLKDHGIPFDQSDYKKFTSGKNIINEYAEFDCYLDHSYSKTINDIVMSDGKLYQANFNSALANGKNIQEIGILSGKYLDKGTAEWNCYRDMGQREIYRI
ncbi:MAG TPA: hypothetical protein DCQ76_00390 [Ruminococcaceae bacterium]|nr:hypothetical protein [Oscillospiraceae bacterium]